MQDQVSRNPAAIASTSIDSTSIDSTSIAATISHLTGADTLITSTISESRLEYLVRTLRATPRFLQGIFPFAGRGVYDLVPLHETLSYVVPAEKKTQVVYFRVGNVSDDLLYLTVSANGQAVRYFPVGPKSDCHVPLAIVEAYPASTRIEVCLAAPRHSPTRARARSSASLHSDCGPGWLSWGPWASKYRPQANKPTSKSRQNALSWKRLSSWTGFM